MTTSLSQQYHRSIGYKIALLVAAAILLPVMLCVSIAVGAASVPLAETVRILCGYKAEPRLVAIVMDIRLPQSLAAIIAGAGLAVSGATMQGVLRNPLCSPATLGIAHAAAFGAALALFIGGGQVVAMDNTLAGYGLSKGIVAGGAFLFAMLTAGIMLALGRLRGTRSESLILIGLAMNALFYAGLTLLQYLADDARLAAIVYWTFGDTARATWNGIAFMTVCLLPVSAYFILQSWNYNALMFGEETAQGLGVPVRQLRIVTLLLASFLTAVLVSLLGIIGFVGLVVPHLARLAIGSDNRFLLPFSFLFGGLLLLVSDTCARLIHAPGVLPVSILTAFIGVPVFLGLLLGKKSL